MALRAAPPRMRRPPRFARRTTQCRSDEPGGAVAKRSPRQRAAAAQASKVIGAAAEPSARRAAWTSISTSASASTHTPGSIVSPRTTMSPRTWYGDPSSVQVSSTIVPPGIVVPPVPACDAVAGTAQRASARTGRGIMAAAGRGPCILPAGGRPERSSEAPGRRPDPALRTRLFRQRVPAGDVPGLGLQAGRRCRREAAQK